MIFIISDIHGNIDALKKFFGTIKTKPGDKIYSLGDYMGYYYHSNECLNLLRKKRVNCIKGNHDINFIKSLKNKKILKKFNERYGNAYFEASQKITLKNLLFLKRMKTKMEIKIKDKKILLSHGSPWKNDFYLYPDVKKIFLKKFLKYKHEIFFVGHTHRKHTHKYKNKIIYNPGSIGQPRDGIKGINWIQFDPLTKKVTFHNKTYNANKIKREIKLKDEAKYNKLAKYF